MLQKTIQLCIALLLIVPQFAYAQKTINGTVVGNADQKPIAGASILIKDTAKGTTTNEQGKFSIQATVGM